METNCLLELPMEEGSEILSNRNLKPDIREGTAGNENDDECLLLDTSEENTGTTTYSTTGIDFEFVNPELESGSNYTMDHSSVFDISEPVIEEKSELFRDSGVFDDCIAKQSELEKQQNVTCDFQTGKRLIMDLGLRLQIIPLNNLKLVSTIQTSEGVHFVALPDNSSISQSSMPDQPLIQEIVQHLNSSKSVSVNNVRVLESGDLGNLNTDQSKTKNTLKVVELKNYDSTTPNTLPPKGSGFGNIKRSTNSIATVKSQQCRSGQQIKKHFGKVKKDISEKKESFYINSKTDEQILKSAFVQTAPKKEKVPKVNQVLEESQCSNRSLPNESKIIIDLKKVLPQKKPRRMISLLNSPKSYRLHTNRGVNMNPKMHIETASSLHEPPFQIASNTTLASAKVSSKLFSTKKCTVVAESDKDKIKHIKQKSSKKIVKSVNNQKLAYGKAIKEINRQKKLTRVGTYRKHKCKVCQAKFIRLGNFRNHLSLHKSYIQLSKDNLQKLTKTADILNFDTTTGVSLEKAVRASKYSNGRKIKLSTNEKKPVTCTSIDHPSKGIGKRIQNLEIDTCAVYELNKKTTNDNSKAVHHMVKSSLNIENDETKQSDLKDFSISEDVSQDEHSDEEKLMNDVSQDDLQCHICQLTLSSVGNLTRHKLTHMVSFCCQSGQSVQKG